MFQYLPWLFLPVVGTTLGAAAVAVPSSLFGGGRRLLPSAYALFAGMMVSSAFFGLLMPAVATEENRMLPLFGFAFGFLLLRLLNVCLDRAERFFSGRGNALSRLKSDDGSDKTALFLFLAAFLHNLPEGLAVGSALAGISAGLPAEGAFSAVLGIAAQNLPDGAMVSIPLYLAGASKKRALFLGFLTGLAEPAAGFLAMLSFGAATRILPFLLAFSAAVMIDASVSELFPKMNAKSGVQMLFFAGGFLLMMATDAFL